jgi:hypothetical protein
MSDDEPLLCSRCLKTLQPGRGEFFVVRIDAVTDPAPPEISDDDLRRDTRRDWREILAALSDVSSQEALDQVYRRVVIHLCNACFRVWIENPAENDETR